ncbi:hypothetical protein N9B88_01850 [Rubripirellula sp.]|jgi:hypothetical protein|nr:hypothetical protein [Rubripirellula sp.]
MSPNLIAETSEGSTMQAAQFLMVGGFVMLAWVLARRKIRAGRKVHNDTKRANREIKLMREHKEPSVPLSGAPVETQRWQTAMFDLQRELKAELDTRIIVVQTLLNQVDEKINQLNSLQSGLEPAQASDPSLRNEIHELLQRGLNAREIAMKIGMPLDDVELTIAKL